MYAYVLIWVRISDTKKPKTATKRNKRNSDGLMGSFARYYLGIRGAAVAHPPVVIVDEHDQVIGHMPLREVWKSGAYHRIVRVFIEDNRGRVLLQKRSMQVELYPGHWDVSAAGHVDKGMSYETAVRQELAEELGVKSGTLQEVGYYQSNETYKGRKLNRFNKLYRLHANDTPESLETEEVSEVRWFSEQELRELVIAHPERLSDGLFQMLELVYGVHAPEAALVIRDTIS